MIFLSSILIFSLISYKLIENSKEKFHKIEKKTNQYFDFNKIKKNPIQFFNIS